MMEARTVSVSVARPAREVYVYLANPVHLPDWSGFITHISPDGEDWIARTPAGQVRIRFTPLNDLGVLDHDVSVNPQLTVHVPMRVVRNAEGCEVMFTVFRQPGMSANDYEADIGMVRRDLLNLKRLIEAW